VLGERELEGENMTDELLQILFYHANALKMINKYLLCINEVAGSNLSPRLKSKACFQKFQVKGKHKR
jgi:hypothetical protein